MARLIDADTLLADIHNAMCADCNDECAACQWRDAIRLIEEAPTIGGWVSVKDRLPENETEVIIIVQHKIGWYRAFAWHDEYGWHSSAEEFGDGESDFVTYWTPLPEPPEEVSGDEG